MRIVRLQVEGFKRLVAVDITPDGDLVEVRGDNENGKTSILDAIFVALAGASHAPATPVRKGEEMAIIRLDLGELVVTRIFTDDGTTRLKVTNADGSAVYSSGQTMLDALVGHIAFDPLEFSRLKADDQAEQLRSLIDLGDIDPDAIEKANALEYIERRDLARDAKALGARLDSIPKLDKPETLPDRNALVAQLSEAASKNSAILAEKAERESTLREAERVSLKIAALKESIEGLKVDLSENEEVFSKIQREANNWPELIDLVDVESLREQIDAADKIKTTVDQIKQREALVADHEALVAKVNGLTSSMRARDKLVADALAAAKMPVEGLSLAPDDKGKLGVIYNDLPLSDASSAVQLRVSVAVAMAANPKLRVLRVKDGSLLDKKSLEILREMATASDFQIWGEFVGEGEGTGIIMEAGEVRGAPKPEPLDRPRRRKTTENAETETEKVETSTDEAFDPETGELASKAEPEINKHVEAVVPREAATTMFESMGVTEEPKRRPRAMTEFVTKPRGA